MQALTIYAAMYHIGVETEQKASSGLSDAHECVGGGSYRHTQSYTLPLNRLSARCWFLIIASFSAAHLKRDLHMFSRFLQALL